MKIGLIGDEYMAVYEWKTNVAPLYKKEAPDARQTVGLYIG